VVGGAKGMGFLERPFIRSGILWEHSGNNKIPLPRFPPNTLPKGKTNYRLLGACCNLSLAEKNFYCQLHSLPILA